MVRSIVFLFNMIYSSLFGYVVSENMFLEVFSLVDNMFFFVLFIENRILVIRNL